MFCDNLKALRKSKGLSQEALAIQLHVVRQTVSKWEKGLSVPDADVLVLLADTFEVPVSKLLGASIEDERDLDVVAEQLSRINEQLAVKNRRARRIWKVVAIVLVSFLIVTTVLAVLGVVSYGTIKQEKFQREISAEQGI